MAESHSAVEVPWIVEGRPSPDGMSSDQQQGSPEEADVLTSHGGFGLVRVHAPDQLLVAHAESLVGLAGERDDGRGRLGPSSLARVARTDGPRGMLGGLDEQSPESGVAALGDGSSPDALARGALRRHQAAVAGDLVGAAEATRVFAIENFERDSGLLTLSFGASDISLFVDGGEWSWERTKGYNPYTGEAIPADSWQGNYAGYLEEMLGGILSGQMNIFVRPIDATTTEVKVRARYVVTTNRGGDDSTWSFDTGGSDTVRVMNPSPGTPETRTLRPTHLAERSILDAVEQLSGE